MNAINSCSLEQDQHPQQQAASSRGVRYFLDPADVTLTNVIHSRSLKQINTNNRHSLKQPQADLSRIGSVAAALSSCCLELPQAGIDL
ncbi:unnamed protein product [Clonostachys rosea f. rosea IK726]|uniref:Uncharacterized protein n=1 Tax=Clonostachys rosea f. rosea IK726 TaxID=1349383 RepID=A0ACA9TIN6_BIOOC|nr:unnamed protein product [Clonostachys rosea f. rosea IK726]